MLRRLNGINEVRDGVLRLKYSMHGSPAISNLKKFTGTLWDLQRGVIESPTPELAASPPPPSSKKKKKKGTQNVAEQAKAKIFGKAPLSRLAELGKRLGLASLVKRIDALTWERVGEVRLNISGHKMKHKPRGGFPALALH